MLLSPEEHAACTEMPPASRLRDFVGGVYPAIKAWRRDNCTPDRVYEDIMVHMKNGDIDAPRDVPSQQRISEALFKLRNILRTATTTIPSRSRSRMERSRTLYDDMGQVNDRFPQLRDPSKLAHLFYAVAIEAAPDDLLRAVIDFYSAELAQTASDYEPAIVVRALYGLRRGWTDKFYGRSLAALQEMLRTYGEVMAAPGPGTYYSKCVNIIQSSGTGKSRLMAALADHEVSVPFVFRSNGESGYPPGDPEIRLFLLVPPTEEPREVHARSLGLLHAIFDELATWLATLPPPAISATEVAKHLADLMAPPPIDTPPPVEPNLSDMFAYSRSDFKKAFCLRVIDRAKLETARLREDGEWNTFFNAAKHHIPPVPYLYQTFHRLAPVQEFKEAALKVCKELERRPSGKGEKPLVVLVFDEARALAEPEQPCNVYTAVRRILGCIDCLPVWGFFLSTNASLATLGRPRHLDQSSRIVEGSLHRVCSYYALPINLGMVERFEDRHKPGGDVTLTPLAQVGTVAHMTLYGRPLWRIYRDESLCTLRDFAMSKLLCDAVKGRYDPGNEGHVFAALAARISLDPCSTPAVLSSSADADDRAQAVKTAVDMHLRMIVNIDEATGVVTTTTPSEPVVSDAVAFEFACNPIPLWTHSIDCLVRKLLPRGIVDKGTKGELYARVLFVMAIDMLRHEGNLADKDKPFEPVRLLDFLKQLLAPEAYATLVDMQAKQETRRNPRRASEATNTGSDTDSLTEEQDDTDMLTEEQEDETAADPVSQTVGSAFANAFVHFTRFVDTDVHMKPQGAKELLHMLFLQQAALQGAWTQPAWDLLIPVYMGDTRDAFDRAKVTALLVQIKNRTKKETLKAMMRKRDLTATFGSDFAWPVLFLVLELGIPRTETWGGEKEVCMPFSSFSTNVFQCTLFGALERTYAPLRKSPNLQTLCNALLARTIQQQQPTIAESICFDNKVFRLQTFQEQFGSRTTTGDVPAAGNQDEKETTKGSDMCVD